MSSTYIDPPIVTDPDDLAAIAIAVLQAQFPGWNPNAGDLLTWAIEAAAAMDAEAANVAAAVPKAIFRFFGPLVGVNPIDAVSATVTSTWTMVDNAGYTIPAGTLVAIPAPGGTTLPFSVLADVIVAPGSTVTATGGVTLIAVTPGAAGSGLGSPALAVSPINILDFVTSVTLVAATTGGLDAETDAAFLNRLAFELRLIAPRPILPPDFSALALNIAGVGRALALDLYKPAVNEVQTVTVNATGGTFTLSFGGHTTSALAWNASAATVQAALVALVSIGAGGVSCTGGLLGASPVTVTFIGANAGTNEAQMTADSTSLTGGTHTATVATVTNGAAAVTSSERTVTVALADIDGNDVDNTIHAAVLASLTAQREVNFLVYTIPPTFNGIDVTATFNVAAGYDPAATETAVEAAIAAFLNPANWGIPAGGDQSLWNDTEVVRLGDVFATVANVQGVSHAVTVLMCHAGGSPAAADVTLTGPAALTTAGTIEASAV